MITRFISPDSGPLTRIQTRPLVCRPFPPMEHTLRRSKYDFHDKREQSPQLGRTENDTYRFESLLRQKARSGTERQRFQARRYL